ncbi:trace amine-associated receptor 13c-like [Polypterus senegalus]|uniref:trace amine-associated receptor 13c-like n=1 Tax=Polypterus senegalus TaxID=55291 RepID=UPI00196302CD|nr:trace amine-associated receptor 13c-like [Polypterus senegalus]
MKYLIQQEEQYCYPSDNTSCLREIRAPVVNLILYFLSAVVVMVAVFGNLVVIISFSHFKQLHTPSNLLVLSLAVADLLIGIFCMPLMLIKLIDKCWYFGDMLCFIYSLMNLLLTSVSISNLVFIAIDRYVAICDPLLYSTKITIHVTQMFIATSWILSMLYTWMITYFKGVYFNFETTQFCLGVCELGYNVTWGFIDLLVSFILPCSVLATLYTKVFIVAKRHVRIINSVTQNRNTGKNQSNISKQSERKAAKTLGIVVAVFLLCWIPYYLCIIIDSYTNSSTPIVAFHISTCLVFFNSGLNPVIYALFYPWFQKSVRLIVSLKICSPASSLINLLPEKH